MRDLHGDSSHTTTAGATTVRDGFVDFVQNTAYGPDQRLVSGTYYPNPAAEAGIQLPSYPQLVADGKNEKQPGFVNGLKMVGQSALYSAVQRPLESVVQVTHHLPGLELRNLHAPKLVTPVEGDTWESQVGSTLGSLAVMAFIVNTTDESLGILGFGDPTAANATLGTKLLSSGAVAASSSLITPVADGPDYWHNKFKNAEGSFSGVLASETVSGPVKQFLGTTDLGPQVTRALTSMATNAAKVAIDSAFIGTPLTATQFKNIGKAGISSLVTGTFQQYTGTDLEGNLLANTASSLTTSALDVAIINRGQPATPEQLAEIHKAGQSALSNGIAIVISKELQVTVTDAFTGGQVDDLIQQAIQAGVQQTQKKHDSDKPEGSTTTPKDTAK